MFGRRVGDVVAEFKMKRAVKKNHAFLIVEGNDDSKFWRPRIGANCEIIVASCKSVGIRAIRRLNSLGLSGYIGVFDRDYDDIETRSEWRQNAIFWDAHSLETVLFHSGSFDKLIAEQIDDASRSAIETASGKTVRELVRDSALQVGNVRYVHILSSSNGDPDLLSPHRHSNPSGSSILDSESILDAGVTCGAAPSKAQLKVAIRAYAKMDARFLMRGHDISAIIYILIQRCGRECAPKKIEELLRAGYEGTDLVVTTIYAEIRDWETVRAPYKVMP